MKNSFFVLVLVFGAGVFVGGSMFGSDEVAEAPVAMEPVAVVDTSFEPAIELPVETDPEPLEDPTVFKGFASSIQLADYPTSNPGYFGTTKFDYRTGKECPYGIDRKNLNSGEVENLFCDGSDLDSRLEPGTNHSMALFAEPANSRTIVFRSVLFDTDAGMGGFFSFDTDTGIISRMEINSIDTERWFFAGDFSQLLSDHTAMVAVPFNNTDGDVRKLYLLDLVNDTSRVLVELAKGETLNAGIGAKTNSFDFEWVSDKILKYAVYDQGEKKVDSGSQITPLDELFIEHRKVSI
jgi:hypothetical protein